MLPKCRIVLQWDPFTWYWGWYILSCLVSLRFFRSNKNIFYFVYSQIWFWWMVWWMLILPNEHYWRIILVVSKSWWIQILKKLYQQWHWQHIIILFYSCISIWQTKTRTTWFSEMINCIIIWCNQLFLWFCSIRFRVQNLNWK